MILIRTSDPKDSDHYYDCINDDFMIEAYNNKHILYTYNRSKYEIILSANNILDLIIGGIA